MRPRGTAVIDLRSGMMQRLPVAHLRTSTADYTNLAIRSSPGHPACRALARLPELMDSRRTRRPLRPLSPKGRDAMGRRRGYGTIVAVKPTDGAPHGTERPKPIPRRL